MGGVITAGSSAATNPHAGKYTEMTLFRQRGAGGWQPQPLPYPLGLRQRSAKNWCSSKKKASNIAVQGSSSPKEFEFVRSLPWPGIMVQSSLSHHTTIFGSYDSSTSPLAVNRRPPRRRYPWPGRVLHKFELPMQCNIAQAKAIHLIATLVPYSMPCAGRQDITHYGRMSYADMIGTDHFSEWIHDMKQSVSLVTIRFILCPCRFIYDSLCPSGPSRHQWRHRARVRQGRGGGWTPGKPQPPLPGGRRGP